METIKIKSKGMVRYDFMVDDLSEKPKKYADTVKRYIVHSSNNERDVRKFCTSFLCKSLSKEFVDAQKKIELEKGNRVSKWEFETYYKKFEQIEPGVFEYICVRPSCE